MCSEYAAKYNDLKIFVIDPLGVEVMNEHRDSGALITAETEGFKKLQRQVIGASRRSLREILGGDRAEFSKVMRFFD